MFHYSIFGVAGEQLAPYADLCGFVPEIGDRLEQFNYRGSELVTEEEWQEWVRAAVEATREVFRRL
ncbi:MAG: hypothetical protein OWU33_07665 [Firmicutes bacterium]|nr:hypothetical protein [Bacillota bacterium]